MAVSNGYHSALVLCPPALSSASPAEALTTVQPAQGVIESCPQSGCSALDGLVNALSLMRDRYGRMTFEPRLHHATFIALPALFSVLVADMDNDAGNVLRQLAQGALHLGLDPPLHLLAAFDTVARIGLNFQDFLLVPFALAL
jgi:hypothetical protein